MNVRQLQALRKRQAHLSTVAPPGVSRRRFMQATGGVAAGAAIAGQLLRPWTVYAAGDDPLPLPSGSLGPFRVFAPYRLDDPNLQLDPPDAEPATITNFSGVVGLAYIDSTVKRTKISTGETVELPSFFSDMRFMNGVYKGVDGKPRQGTFALI
jgi:hypothetical protein